MKKKAVSGYRLAIPAERGSLTPAALRAARGMHAFMVEGYELLEALIGSKLPRTYLRNSIIRLAVIECGEGRRQKIAYYQQHLAAVAGKFAVREEIYTLASLGLLVLQESPTDKRLTCVAPSQRLIEWYCRVAAPLITRFAKAHIDETGKIG